METDLNYIKNLINEFIDLKIKGDKPYFNFYLFYGEIKSFDNLIEFLQLEEKLTYKEILVTPF